MVAQMLTSASAVIDALGGTKATSRVTGRTLQAVSNWRREGRLPPTTYVLLRGELARIGFDAPARLWGMISHANDGGPLAEEVIR